MRPQQSRVTPLIQALLVAGSGLSVGSAGAADEYTTQFPLEQCTLVPHGRNPRFSLHPGDMNVLEGLDDGEEIRVEITVLDEKRRIEFVTENGVQLTVTTRVVQERESADGELIEISRNFFARCEQTDDVYYFGEDVDIYEDGEIVSHEGAWLAGEDGALPGLIMPGTFLLGSRYFQEQAPEVAEDRAKHVRMGLTLDLPAGRFTNCVKVRESSRLDQGAKSTKKYCPGVGLVVDDEVELVDFERAAEGQD